jgi:hypothetical protein
MKNQLKPILLSFLSTVWLTSCLPTASKLSADGANTVKSTVSIDSYDVYVNGVLQTARPVDFVVGDTVTMVAHGSDITGQAIEYKFSLFHNGVLSQVLQDFSNSNTMSAYTLTDADNNGANFITISARNRDGIDDLNAASGDAMLMAGLRARGYTLPPTVSGVKIYVNGVLQSSIPGGQLFYPITAHLGDVVSWEIDVTDPKGLPLSYKLSHFSNGIVDQTLQDFSPNNILTYTVTADDLTKTSLALLIGIKNNDDHDYINAFTGDVQELFGLRVSP